jgi:DNA polymerase III subunit delta'
VDSTTLHAGQTPDGAVALGQDGERVRAILQRLAHNPEHEPPQVLLFEGGSAASRLETARYWGAVLNCTSASRDACGECRPCRQIFSQAHRDLFLLDGADESIKIDEVRELRRILGEPPREARVRVVILNEAQALGIEAANALLKSLEEPRPYTKFVLCAPQRERLLPTLVSRGWVLTLSWGDPLRLEEDEAVREWLDALAGMARDGRGWMSRTSSKGALDRSLALRVCLGCQRELLRALLGRAESALGALLRDTLNPERRRQLDEALFETITALDSNVSPPLALDWLAVTLHRLARG